MAPGLDLTLLAEHVDKTIPSKDQQNGTNPPRPHPLLAPKTQVLHPSLITTAFDALRFEAAAFDQLLNFPPPTDPIPTSPTNPTSKTNLFLPLLDKKTDTKSAPVPTPTASVSKFLDRPPPDIKTPRYSTQLISSPYNNSSHYLDLTTLSPPHLKFAKSLTALKPARSDYATAPYEQALNFPDVLEVLRRLCSQDGTEWTERSWYVVVFRSILKASVARVPEDGGVNEEFEELYKLDYESHGEACQSGGLVKYWFGKCDAERRNLATCFWRSREDAYRGGLGPWHKKARAAARRLYDEITFTTLRFTVLDGAWEFRVEPWVD